MDNWLTGRIHRLISMIITFFTLYEFTGKLDEDKYTAKLLLHQSPTRHSA